MKPADFKRKAHEAYRRAISNASMWTTSFSDPGQMLFRNMSVYGRDGGADFAATHISEIRDAILEAAAAKQQSLDLHPYQFGRSARDGMVKTLEDLTLMDVKLQGNAITITWARNTIDLI